MSKPSEIANQPYIWENTPYVLLMEEEYTENC